MMPNPRYSLFALYGQEREHAIEEAKRREMRVWLAMQAGFPALPFVICLLVFTSRGTNLGSLQWDKLWGLPELLFLAISVAVSVFVSLLRLPTHARTRGVRIALWVLGLTGFLPMFVYQDMLGLRLQGQAPGNPWLLTVVAIVVAYAVGYYGQLRVAAHQISRTQ
jgi:hypothetical protein